MYQIYPAECQRAANAVLKTLEGVCSGKAEHIGRLGGIITILQEQTDVLSLIFAAWANSSTSDPLMEENSNPQTENK